jgi:two-component system cell cycle sensor histidine kinase/response regulator CckA
VKNLSAIKFGITFLLSALFMAFNAMLPALAAAQSGPGHNVLVLNSYHRGKPFQDLIVSGIQDTFDHSDLNVSLYYEDMDAKRYALDKIESYMKELYTYKYAHKKLDAILAIDNNALDFVLKFRKELFPKIPVVFCGINGFTDSMLEGQEDITGILEEQNFTETIRLALKLHPNTQHVVTISDGTLNGRLMLYDFHNSLKSLGTTTDSLDLINLSPDEVRARLSALPANTPVFPLSYNVTPEGELIPENLRWDLPAESGLPGYAILDYSLRYGLIGGYVMDGHLQGAAAAAMVQRILKGEPASAIPLLKETPTIPKFNYIQLKKFGIKESDLPADAIILNKPIPSFHEYKKIIWGAVALFSVLSITIFVLAVNILKRRKAEKALLENQIIFQSFLEYSPVYIFFKDHEIRSLMLSRNFEKMLGMPLENILGKTMDEVFPSDVAKSMIKDDKRILNEGKCITVVEELYGKIYETTKFPVFTDGKPNMLAGFTLDITERKQAEDDKAKLEEQLRQSYKLEAIGTLAGGIAHDFNNILTVIIGYAEITKYNVAPDSIISENLDKVLQAGHRAKDLVQQILTFSRQSKMELIPVKLQPIIKEALKMLRTSIPRSIEIRENIAQDCGTVIANPTQLYQILMNLCTNAFHAMEENGGVLTVELKIADNIPLVFAKTRDNSQEVFVELSISDTGQGIRPEIIDKIFDPFFTTKEKGKGTGMGLAITYGVIKEYGGEITVDSQLGRGTVFHIYLPQSGEEAVAVDSTVADLPRGKERILFVDDEDLLAELGKKMLERLGYQVTVKTKSFEALGTFQNQPYDFDLVITDQTMPGMTGLDMARRMLQIRHNIPIILCTGYSARVDEEKAKSQGIKEFAMKPLNNSTIARLIRKVLDAA